MPTAAPAQAASETDAPQIAQPGSEAAQTAPAQTASPGATASVLPDSGAPATAGPAPGLAEATPNPGLPQGALAETAPSQAGEHQAGEAIQLAPARDGLAPTPPETPAVATPADDPMAGDTGEAAAEPAPAAVAAAAPAQPLPPVEQAGIAESTAPAEEVVDQSVATIGAAHGQGRAAGQHPTHGAEPAAAVEKPDAASPSAQDGVRPDAGAAVRLPGSEQVAQGSSQSSATPVPHFASHLAATGAAGHAAPTTQAPAETQPGGQVHVVADVPLGAVPIEIALKTLAGINRFEIRLDPGDLGRIDVSIEIDDQGEVKTHLAVDKVETLALLQRDARTLERAFEQAGLKPSDGGVNLSLRDQQQHQGHGRQQHSGDGRDSARPPGTETGREHREAAPSPPRRFWRGNTGVDVRI
jgi:flagellar hook-length control protein FliK